MFVDDEVPVSGVYARIIHDRLPKFVVLMQLAEECAEVSKAALKLARIYQGENPTPVTEEEAIMMLNEEVADFFVCCSCIEEIDWDVVSSIYDEKMKRWATRLANVKEQ